MSDIKKILAGLLVVANIANAGDIKPITEEWAPYQMKIDGMLTGISVDIVREIQKRIGNKQKIKIFPWNRGYNMTLKRQGYALFTAARTKDREKLFKWVGPLTQLKLVMFKLKLNKTIYKTAQDMKNAKSIAVTKNDAAQQILASQGYKNLQIKTGGSNQINLKKILNKKAELWPTGYYGGYYRIKQLGVQDKMTVVQAPPFLELPLAIAFNKKTPDEIINKWQKALDNIKADGTYDKILKKYK